MSTPDEPGESGNTYFIDPESGAEMARLTRLDKVLTHALGGVLEGIPRIAQARRILDVACGPGAWALEVAFTYPKVEVVGFDLSNSMVQYANAQAKAQRLNNARFVVMDARKPLDFPDGWFDIVNGRFLAGFMPKETWPRLVKELARITRPGGVIRLTECDDFGVTNSPAFDQFQSFILRAMYKAGISYSPTEQPRNYGLTPMLGYFLRDAGCQNIQQQAHILDFSAGSQAFASNYENMKLGVKLIQPFLLKWEVTTQKQLDTLYERILFEMTMPDFRGLSYIASVWGEKPPA